MESKGQFNKAKRIRVILAGQGGMYGSKKQNKYAANPDPSFSTKNSLSLSKYGGFSIFNVEWEIKERYIN